MNNNIEKKVKTFSRLELCPKQLLAMALLNLTNNQKLIIFRYVQCDKVSGPIQPLFWHYSKLGGDRYHCHLALNWVACWTCKEGSIDIEVYYAGSREKAPY